MTSPFYLFGRPSNRPSPDAIPDAGGEAARFAELVRGVQIGDARAMLDLYECMGNKLLDSPDLQAYT
jgi:hypothetical protein